MNFVNGSCVQNQPASARIVDFVAWPMQQCGWLPHVPFTHGSYKHVCEIAAYGTVCAFAKELREMEQESLLTETLEEEKKSIGNSPRGLGGLGCGGDQ